MIHRMLLIVEDLPEITSLYRKYFIDSSGKKMKIKSVKTIQEALKYPKENINMVILDIVFEQSPEGYEFLTTYPPDKRNFSIVVVSAAGSMTLEQCRLLGADHIISKGDVKLPELAQKIFAIYNLENYGKNKPSSGHEHTKRTRSSDLETDQGKGECDNRQCARRWRPFRAWRGLFKGFFKKRS